MLKCQNKTSNKTSNKVQKLSKLSSINNKINQAVKLKKQNLNSLFIWIISLNSLNNKCRSPMSE